jgi:2,3-bisphosphoglycerate-dependent phosphoglycerate mutase
VEIVLVRHGQPQWVKDGRCVVNPPLTSRGFSQADRMGEALGGEQFDEFYVSPLLRARQTAAPLATRLGCEPTVVDWLQECREPDWDGEPAQVAVDAYAAERLLLPHERWAGIQGGETMRDFTDRIHAGLTDFLAEHGIRRLSTDLPLWDVDNPGRRLVWVAHAGTNTVAISHLLGLAPVPWEWDRFRLGHASICRLSAIPVHDHFTFSVNLLSGVEHLSEDLRTI